jgi:hypothetical protein
MNGTANIVTGPPTVPGPCPHHPGCTLIRCGHLWCNNVVHLLNQPGRPRRFCSTRCRVAAHRGTGPTHQPAKIN